MRKFLIAVVLVGLFAATADAAGCACKGCKCKRPAPVKRVYKWIRR